MTKPAYTAYSLENPLDPALGATHLEQATTFPHVYGPIELAAIREVGVLTRTAGGYAWPRQIEKLERLLAGD